MQKHRQGILISFLLVTVLLFACNRKNTSPVKQKVTKKYNIAAKRTLFADSASFANRFYRSEALVDPTVIDTTDLFSDPDSASAKIARLPPLTQISILDTTAVSAPDSVSV